MSYDCLKIQYQNFSPELEEKKLILEVMRKVEFSAPSDSLIQLDLKKTWEGFVGYCRVVSGVGLFTAEHKAKSLEEIIAHIEKALHKQINNWKAKRFQEKRESASNMATAS